MQLAIQTLSEKKVIQLRRSYKITTSHLLPKMISGTIQKFIKWLMWGNIFIVALKKFRDPFMAIQKIRQLKKIRNQYRNQRPPVKYSYVNTALGSISLFIASAKNKRKANAELFFWKQCRLFSNIHLSNIHTGQFD
jgi:hypothetical protein